MNLFHIEKVNSNQHNLTFIINTQFGSNYISTSRSIPDHKSIHRVARYVDVEDDSVFQLLDEADAQLVIVAIES